MQIETKEQEMIISALKNGTLACLPGADGFADTQPVVNIYILCRELASVITDTA